MRGFHVYKTNWKPQNGELLKCTHKEDNPYDIFSMKVCKPDSDEIVGHLPVEMSRISSLLIGVQNVHWRYVGCTTEETLLFRVGLKFHVGDHYNDQRCCKPPSSISIQIVAQRTLYQALGWGNSGHFPFSSPTCKWDWINCRSIATTITA